MGHKGPVLRPRCIGPGRARTRLLFYSILLNKLVAILLSEKCRKSMNVREIGRG